MFDLDYLLQAFVVPIVALALPFAWIFYVKSYQNKGFTIDTRKAIKYGIVSIIIAIVSFTLLIYLTGGINYYYHLEVGFFGDDRSIIFNIDRHWSILIAYNPGMSLFAVSVLSGLIYGGLLTLPVICKIEPSSKTNISSEEGIIQESGSLSTATSSVFSSIIAGGSALASGVVCCSTSLLAFIAPTFGLALAPFAPLLIIFSLGLLEFSFAKFITPRLLV